MERQLGVSAKVVWVLVLESRNVRFPLSSAAATVLVFALFRQLRAEQTLHRFCFFTVLLEDGWESWCNRRERPGGERRRAGCTCGTIMVTKEVLISFFYPFNLKKCGLWLITSEIPNSPSYIFVNKVYHMIHTEVGVYIKGRLKVG